MKNILIVLLVFMIFSCRSKQNSSTVSTLKDNTQYNTKKHKEINDDKSAEERFVADQKDEESYTVQQGKRFLNNNDYITAISYFTEAINEDVGDSDAYFYRGNAYYQKGEFEKAIKDYNYLLQKTTRIRGYQINTTKINRGNAYRFIGDYDEAIYNFTSVIKSDSELSDLAEAFGLDDAKQNLEEFENAYFFRALAFTAKNDLNNALSDYTNAININPNNSVYYNNRGNIYKELNQNLNSINDYLKAIEIEPNDFSSNYNLGQSYFYNKEYDKALIYLNKAIGIEPNKYPKAYVYIALSYYQLNDIDNAINNFELVINKEPNSGEYKKALAELYMNRGVNFSQKQDFRNAVQDFRNAVKYDPQNEKYKSMLNTAEFGVKLLE